MGISTVKKVVLGAAVGIVTVIGLVAPASAHRRHHHHHHFRHWHAPAYVTYGHDGCGYLYRKWKYTGSSYWKHKYFACIY